MQGLSLKDYQQESLEAIERFCNAVRAGVGHRAVRPVHDAYYLETRRDSKFRKEALIGQLNACGACRTML